MPVYYSMMQYIQAQY